VIVSFQYLIRLANFSGIIVIVDWNSNGPDRCNLFLYFSIFSEAIELFVKGICLLKNPYYIVMRVIGLILGFHTLYHIHPFNNSLYLTDYFHPNFYKVLFKAIRK